MITTQSMTVADAVTLVDQKKLVLPGIQRNFVWKPAQIALLFDSLVRGYPIGTMLLWRTKRSEHPQLQFRRLVTEYQGPDTLPANAHVVADLPVLGVLDGQQRLTALSIGLQGTYAATSQAPGRSLYIDLDQEPGPDEGSDDETDGSGYSFKFLADEAKNDSGTWFKVADARGLGTDAQSLNKAIKVAGHAADAATRSVLKKLAVALNTTESVHFDIEESGDLDRVLNIFGRTNGEGTRLTSVDLLVSTATAKWTTLNARAEVTNLRKSMNSQSSEPFRFTDDRIMKAGLVLLDVPAPKLRVELFLHGNKAKALEDMWPEFSRSMITAAAMLASFGLSGTSLAGENVIIPLAFYAHHRNLQPTYATAHVHEADRRRVRAFVARTLLQRRYWTGAVDPVLLAARRVIKAHGQKAFPLSELEKALKKEAVAKPIDVTEQFIDELCLLRFGDRRTYPLLRMLFPHMTHGVMPVTGLHKDHIFPKSKFTAHNFANLAQAAELLPNLQLLRPEDNGPGGKGNRLPKEWLASLSQTARSQYAAQDVKHLPDFVGCEAFWDKRKDSLRTRIEGLLQM
jgi:hypothetical protein